MAEQVFLLVDYVKGIKGVSKIAFNIKGGYSLEQEFALLKIGKTSAGMLKRAGSLINYLNLFKTKMETVGEGYSNYQLLDTLKRNSAKIVSKLEEKKIQPRFTMVKREGIDLE